MLTNITWGTYGSTAALLLILWYFIVGVRFYYHDLRGMLTGQGKPPFSSGSPHSSGPPAESQAPETGMAASAFGVSDPTFDDVDALIKGLKESIGQAAQRRTPKEEFLKFLQLLLKEYPTVKHSPFKASVSEFIVSECAAADTTGISQEEAEALWEFEN